MQNSGSSSSSSTKYLYAAESLADGLSDEVQACMAKYRKIVPKASSTQASTNDIGTNGINIVVTPPHVSVATNSFAQPTNMILGTSPSLDLTSVHISNDVVAAATKPEVANCLAQPATMILRETSALDLNSVLVSNNVVPATTQPEVANSLAQPNPATIIPGETPASDLNSVLVSNNVVAATTQPEVANSLAQPSPATIIVGETPALDLNSVQNLNSDAATMTKPEVSAKQDDLTVQESVPSTGSEQAGGENILNTDEILAAHDSSATNAEVTENEELPGQEDDVVIIDSPKDIPSKVAQEIVLSSDDDSDSDDLDWNLTNEAIAKVVDMFLTVKKPVRKRKLPELPVIHSVATQTGDSSDSQPDQRQSIRIIPESIQTVLKSRVGATNSPADVGNKKVQNSAPIETSPQQPLHSPSIPAQCRAKPLAACSPVHVVKPLAPLQPKPVETPQSPSLQQHHPVLVAFIKSRPETTISLIPITTSNSTNTSVISLPVSVPQPRAHPSVSLIPLNGMPSQNT